MLFLKKLIKLCFNDRLKTIFNDDEVKISLLIENFFYSFIKFNFFLKFLISIFLLLTVILNFFYIIIYFFKLRLNFFPEATKFASKIPYFKNINNFILANLLLHLE